MFKATQVSVKEEETAQTPAPAQTDVKFKFDRELFAWLEENEVSLGFTTYQANKVFLVGRQSNAPSLSLYEHTFTQPLGLGTSTDGEQLIMSSLFQIWRFSNAVPPFLVNTRYDKLYIPQVNYTTISCEAHDLGFDKNGCIIFVDTKLSCLAKVSETTGVAPIWNPPFISRLVREDRCHLNGLAFREGEPRYVTACSQTDTIEGWRNHRQDGGFVMDIQTNEVLCEKLSMPHSPRWYQDRLWVLNSGEGQFGYVNMETKNFTPITFCPGYARGLNFHKSFALIGLSKSRHDQTFEGLPLDKELARRNMQALTGLQLVNIDTRQSIIVLSIDGTINEIYDVILIPNTRTPMLIGGAMEEIHKIIAFYANDFEPAKKNEQAGLIAQTLPSLRAASVPEERSIHFCMSDALLSWMDEQICSFALSLQIGPKTAKLLLFGQNLEGRPSIVIRNFERCGVLAVSEHSRKLYLYDYKKIQYFKNTLADGQQYQGYDACFVPHQNQDPQGTDILDLRLDRINDEDYLFLNSSSGCFVLLPKFTVLPKYTTRLFKDWDFSDLKGEHRLESLCLTGLAMCKGDLRYVTATARTGLSEPIGIVIDTNKKKSIIASNLLQPHSPFWHQDRLWLLDARLQELGYVDPEKKIFKAVFKYPDGINAKGLGFCGDTAVLGVTQKKLGGPYKCSVLFIQITDEHAEIKHWLQLTGDNISLNAISLLPGIKRPYLLDMHEGERMTPVETSSEQLSKKNENEDSDLVNPELWVEDLPVDDPPGITPASSGSDSSTRDNPANRIILSSSSSLFSFWQQHKRPVLWGIGLATGVAAFAVAFAYQKEDSNKATL